MNERLKPFQILIVIGMASLLKLIVGRPDLTPFNADEAIVALMAKHINQGNLPIFFYGQVYMGSLDAILISIGFKIFGEVIWVIRFVQTLLYLGTIITVMVLATRITNSARTGFIAGLLMAVPPVNVTLYTTVSLGGYGEILLIGNLLLLAAISILERIRDREDPLSKNHYLGLLVWGLGAGFAFWVFGLSVLYTLPVMVLVIWLTIGHKPKATVNTILILGLGAIIGSSPWWSEFFRSGDFGILTELTGGAIRNASTGGVIQPFKRLVNLIVFGGTVIVGLRPPWDVRWLMLPLLPFVMIFWLIVLINSGMDLRQDRDNPGKWLLSGMGILLVLGFIFTPYGDDPSGRYFVPLITPMVIFAAILITERIRENKILAISILSLVLVFNLGGTIQSILKNPPGLSTQFDQVAQVDQSMLDDLIDFLDANQINTGYSNYWVAYPLAFQSDERLIFLPRLPYHQDFRYTARDDRYQPYQEIVENADQIAYITTNHPDLDIYIREKLSQKGVDWKEKEIGDFHIFFQLSEVVHVKQLGLGVTTEP